MKTLKIVLCLTALSLLMASQVIADDIEKKKIKLGFYEDGIIIMYDDINDYYRSSHITKVSFNRKTLRLSIWMFRGGTFHYNFHKNQRNYAREALSKLGLWVFNDGTSKRRRLSDRKR